MDGNKIGAHVVNWLEGSMNPKKITMIKIMMMMMVILMKMMMMMMMMMTMMAGGDNLGYSLSWQCFALTEW